MLKTNQEIIRQIRAIGGEKFLNECDLEDFQAASLRVLLLLLDGEWHSPDEIRLAAGTDGLPAAEGLRRMRELRARGYDIELKRVAERRFFMYSLSLPVEKTHPVAAPVVPSKAATTHRERSLFDEI